MKITDRTIKLVTVLSIILSLAFIFASLLIHLQGDRYLPNDTTNQESTSLSFDSEKDTTSPSEDTTVEIQQDITESLTVTTDSTEPDTTDATATADTTEGESTVSVTTFEETSAVIAEEETTEEATLPVEATPETTAHIHSYSDWTLYKAPTCEKNGTNYRVCSCGESEYQFVPAIGHTEKYLPGVNASCTSEGKTDGVICSTCNKIIKNQTIIPKIECNYDDLICVYCGKKKDISISISAPYAGLYKADTLECLFSLNADTKIAPASLTKMVTACVAIENFPLNTVITVGSEISLVPKYSSLCYIYRDQRVKLSDLLTGMLLCSGNDAAYTIAANVGRHASGNSTLGDKEAVEYFCSLMNDYVKKIGAKNTNFTTPDGSDSEGQYSTVNDLAIITSHAMKNKTIAEITSTHYKKVVFVSGQIAKWTNTNELIHPDSPYYTECASGFKTGGTELAGKCLSATFTVDGVEYIAIVMGCEDNDARYENILKLINSIK